MQVFIRYYSEHFTLLKYLFFCIILRHVQGSVCDEAEHSPVRLVLASFSSIPYSELLICPLNL